MLRYLHIRHRPVVVLAALLAVSGVAYAANVSTQSRPDYQRLLFDFGGPARMQVAQGTNSVSLTFNKPVTGDLGQIRAKFAPYVTAASASPDGRTVTLQLNNQYRVRQFISGDVIGIDILTNSITAPPKVAPPPPAPEPIAAPAPTPKPVPQPEPTPEPQPVPKPAPEPQTPEATPPQPEAAPQAIRSEPAPVLTTKPAPAPAPVETPAPATSEPIPAEAPAPVEAVVDPILTTKPVPPPAEAVTALNPEPPPAPAEPEPLVAPIAPEAPAAEASAATTPSAPEPPAPEEIEPEQAAAETALPPPDPDKPFLVSATNRKDGTTINFPWGERTAAAVFERARDIWIVFSRERDVNAKLLAGTLPKAVVRVQQYRLPGATVVRLTTDGSLHASISQQEDGYEWNVSLGSAQPTAALDIPVTAETEEGRRQLVLQAFDVSDPLVFYDPTLDDRLIVVPTFEAGRGVALPKRFPGIDILPTQQGIAAVSQRDDLRVTRTRAGLKLGGSTSLSISENLPIFSADAKPVPGASAAADVLMPYDQWYVGAADFSKEREARLRALTTATEAQAADGAMRMVQLYLGQGMVVEALGYLERLREDHPQYYTDRKLAVLSAASYVMLDRLAEARASIQRPELEGNEEAAMWRALIDVLSPATITTVQRIQNETEAESDALQAAAADAAVEATGETPLPAEVPPLPPRKPVVFDFLGYHERYIRYYPPRIRQRLAVIAADAYIANGEEDEALKTFDTLNRDGILGPVQRYAEFTLASIAAKKDKVKEALATFDRLGAQYDDPYIQARARFAAVTLRHAKGMETPEHTMAALEALRLSWRGDALQREILFTLAQLYRDNKRYDDTLRTEKYLLDSFPEDPDTLTIAGDMAQLFDELFIGGLADEMPPLKSLALFYEFRELTPVGPRGDAIIQKLADRLAAVDLLDRATQLLEHQVKYRVSGEDRARVGARLALLYLLNQQPSEAVSVLEITNYGDAPLELRRQRIQLTAQALSDLGKHEEALSMLFSDDSRDADLLRLDILWAMKDWPNVINQAEDILSDRPNLTAALDMRETEVLMKLALGYSFEGDSIQLRYLRDYYTGLLPESQYKEIFTFLTNDAAPLDPEDFQLVARQISNTESFLDRFRTQIAAGSLSETVK